MTEGKPEKRRVGRPLVPLAERRMSLRLYFYPDDADLLGQVSAARNSTASATINQAFYEFVCRHYPDLASERAKREVGAAGAPPAGRPDETHDE